jgi:hypothetical protein
MTAVAARLESVVSLDHVDSSRDEVKARGSRETSTMFERFPFLFFGAHPADHRPGEQGWLVRVKATLSEADRVALSRAIAQAEGGTGTALSRVLFVDGGQWIYLTARTSEDPDADPAELFVGVRTILRAADRVARIDEVLCTTALGLSSAEWDVWTRQQQSRPSVVPVDFELPWGVFVTRLDSRFYGDEYHRSCAALEPWKLHTDDAFAKSYAQASLLLDVARVDEARAPRPEPEPEPESEQGPLLVLEEVDEAPSSYVPPPRALSKTYRWARCGSGRIVSISSDPRAIEILEPDASAPRRFAPDFSLDGAAWTPDGTRLVATGHECLHVVNLDDFSHRTIAVPLSKASAVFIDDHRLVLSVSGSIGLYRFGPDDAEPVELDRLPTASYHILKAHLGRYLVDVSEDGSVVYAAHGDELRLLGCFQAFTDGAVFVRGGELRIEDLEEDVVYRIGNLAERDDDA